MFPETYGQQFPTINKRNSSEAPPRFELHSVDLATWDDGTWADPFFLEGHPQELDQPWPYRFRSGQRVWVCASNQKWYGGKVVSQAKKGPTRWHEGLFWCVEFQIGRSRVRKWFAPLNGDIKPDIEHTHHLLSNISWVDSDSSE